MMRNLDFNHSKYIIRQEYFGGLLIDRNTLEKYEITKYDTTFFLLLSAFDEDGAVNIVNQYYNVSYRPKLEVFEKMGCFISCDSIRHNAKSVKSILSKQARIAKKNYLSAPISLTIYPTVNCNLRCPFCFAKKRLSQNSLDFSHMMWKKIIDPFISAGAASISILGGEPSLYHDIINLLKMLDQYNLILTMTSNGQEWSDALIDTTINLKNLTPVFSMQAPDDTNSSYMSDFYDINKTAKLIRHLTRGGKSCTINSVYLNQPLEVIKGLVDFCAAEGVIRLSVSLNQQIDRNGRDISCINALREDVLEYIYKMKYKVDFKTEGCMLYSSHIELERTWIESELQKKIFGCQCGNTNIEILNNGDVYSCGSFIAQGIISGNVVKEHPLSVWNSSTELNRLRGYLCKDIICLKCNLYTMCKGGCPSVIMGSHLDIAKSGDPRCQIHRHIKERSNTNVI